MLSFRFRNAVAAALVLSAACSARADVKLPAVLSRSMVLQRDRAIPVWGWADAGEKVTVTLGKQSKSAVAGKNGRWMVKLDSLSAGGPLTLTVSGKNRVTVEDVLVGEVWVCSGQSNMAMTVQRSKNAAEEIAAAKYPRIRMFTVRRHATPKPVADCQGNWAVCSPKTAGQFSAAAYFFGRKLYKELDVPIGLLHTSWGGTPVEAWTSLPAQRRLEAVAPVLERWQKQIAQYDPKTAQQRYETRLARWKQAAKRARSAGRKVPRRPRRPVDPRLDPHRPANLYNGMIAPLVPYAIRGAIWYQGENNAGRGFAHLYGTQLPAMIKDWRRRWGQGDFPFLFVQLPNFRAVQTQPVEPSGWVTVREGMLHTLSVPNTGMAITVDVGEANNIHPKNKQAVGLRLALWALGTTYKKDLVYSGPIYKSCKFAEGKARVLFEHTGQGLKAKDGKELAGFAIAGEDRRFVAAKAKVQGKQVVVWSDEVSKPVAVRYAWAANPVCNLINSAGLPASPFRTDDWPEGAKR